jgi:hypothetical protein
VTVPVARASARRTVRVAAGLVAGQAVLCAVIGYVTLGDPVSRGTNGPRIVDPLAAHPLTLPTPTVPLTSPTAEAPKPPATAGPTHARPPAGTGSRQRTDVTPTPTPTPAAESPPEVLAGTSEPTASTDPTGAPASTAAAPEVPSSGTSTDQPPSPPVTQLSVTIGDICNPLDAPGVAIDGSAARCASDAVGVLRWRTLD